MSVEPATRLKSFLLLFSHYADWAGTQPRLWFAEQESKTEGNTLTHHRENNLEKEREKENHSHEPRKNKAENKKKEKN